MALISKAELAKRAGVAPPAVSYQLKHGLKDAVVDGKVESDHPLVVAWLKAKAAEPKKPPSEPKPRKVDISKKLPHVGGVPTQELADLTLREIVMGYGSIDGFKRFVESLGKIADFNQREMRTQRERGDLIERDKVRRVAFALIDATFKRILSDVPESLSRQIIARIESGDSSDPVGEVSAMMRDALGKALRNCKRSVEKLEILNREN